MAQVLINNPGLLILDEGHNPRSNKSKLRRVLMKAKFVIDLLHKSSYRGERVLLFCHNVSPISFLVELIENVFGWRLGEEVLVLQGDQELPVRSDVMDKFNTDSQGKRKARPGEDRVCLPSGGIWYMGGG
ncbi:hypothetical protein TRIUR3_26285 [Triticum urartu]|uniref:Helicase ATP-binding domain-containing protein n=1 Tax=Triticum urartu TaxID=4572 RepID=M8AZR7_TRIUA|nr:hypothetical protein TRIUR3_26285 [Triticum urartu]